MEFNIMLQGFTALCAFVSIFSIVMLIGEWLRKVEVDSRNEGQEELNRLPVMIKMCLPLARNLDPLVRMPVFEGTRRQTQDLLMQSGLEQVVTADQFVACRIMLGMGGGMLSVMVIIAGQPLPGLGMFLLILMYPVIWLRNVRARRHLAIQKSLPNVLDLLTLSVEAGKDFLSALRDILRRRKQDALGEELGRAFHEIQLGKSRRDALRELSKRVQQPDLTAVLQAVIQADELGVSIGQILRIQGDQLRTKRFQRAETLANEAPVKILVPMILFIFPAVFIILLAPLAVQLMRTFMQ